MSVTMAQSYQGGLINNKQTKGKNATFKKTCLDLFRGVKWAYEYQTDFAHLQSDPSFVHLFRSVVLLHFIAQMLLYTCRKVGMTINLRWMRIKVDD